MKGELIYKILDTLEDGAILAYDLWESVLVAGYGASSGKLEYERRKRTEARDNYQIERENKRKIQKYIYKLKADELIAENRNNQLILSEKGRDKLNLLKNKLTNDQGYKKEAGDKVIIISYDIPNEFNRERDILRNILKRLGFSIVHKSVWVGKVKLPKKLIVSLGRARLLDYIEILEVTKTGSLKSYSL